MIVFGKLAISRSFLLSRSRRRTFIPTAVDLMEEATSLKIYTKTGDKGSSALYTGERRPKNDRVFEALGSTDELSCHLGLAIELCKQEKVPLEEKLEKIQCVLQDIGSNVATPRDTAGPYKLEKTTFDPQENLVKELEQWIDAMDSTLPPLKNFILPGGGMTAAQLHIARAVCRRAERVIVPLALDSQIDPSASKYMNRLSDFLFMAARFACDSLGNSERIYKKTV